MFYKFKTKFYFLKNKKKKTIIIFIIIFIISIIGIVFFVTKNKETVETAIENNSNEVGLGFNENENNTDIEVKNTIYGADLKEKYKEVKGSDFAILVTTHAFLKEYKSEENNQYYRYALEDGDSNRISLIQTSSGEYEDAVFINYNRVLKDTVVIKDISGGYIAPYGFMDEKKLRFHKYSDSKSIEIKDDAVFIEYPIYDGDYNLLGTLYIENFKSDN